MADIKSTSILDAKPFNDELKATLQTVQAWRRNVEKAMDFQPLKTASADIAAFQKAMVKAVSTTAVEPVRMLNGEVAKTRAAFQRAGAAAAVMDKIAVSANGASNGVAKTAKAAVEGGQNFNRFQQEVARAIAEFVKFQGSSNQTAEGFEKVRDRLRSMLDAVEKLASGPGMEAYSAQLTQMRADLEAATFAQETQAVAIRAGDMEFLSAAEAVEYYRDATLSLRNEIEAGVISQEEGARAAVRLRDESLEAAKQTQRWSREYRDLLVASGRMDRTFATLEGRVTKLGISKQFAVAQTNNLTDSYRQLAGAVTAVLAASGLARYVRTLTEASREAAVARNTIALFYKDIELGGYTAERGAAALQLLADQFQATEDSVASGLTLLLRYGATLDQAILIMQRLGASALAAGQSAAQGFEAGSTAIITGMSAALKRIGVAGNLSAAYEKEAKSLGKVTDALTNQEKILAIINHLLPETDREYEALGLTLSGFVGASNRAETAWTNFRRSMGEGAESFLAPIFNAATRLLNLFNDMPAATQKAITTTALLGATVGTAAAAYLTLSTVLARTKVVQNLVLGLLRNETIARTRLGVVIEALALRYKVLTQQQVMSSAATRGLMGGLTGWQVVLRGLSAGFTAATRSVFGFIASSARLVASPLGVILMAIAAAIALVTRAWRENKSVVEPALNAVREAGQRLRDTVRVLIPSLTAFEGIVKAVSQVMGRVLTFAMTQVSLGMARFVLATDKAAASYQYFLDLFTVGPRQAWDNLHKSLGEAEKRFEDLKTEILAAAGAVRDGSGANKDYANSVKVVGTRVTLLTEEMRKLRDEAKKTALTFQQRLQDIRISLMPEGEEQAIERARVEFERLRESIRQAAVDNEQFKPFEAQLLADAFELEQQQILKIQAEYAEQRRREAEAQAKELADAVRERERAIVDEQTRGQLNEAQTASLAYQRRREDTERLYADLIARANEYGRDATEFERLLAGELKAIADGYARDITAIYDRIYQELSDRQRDLVRAAAEARGDTRGLLGIDYAAELKGIDDFYEAARVESAHNADLMALLAQEEAAERLQAHQRYWDAVIALAADRGEALAERERIIARQTAEAAGDRAALARLGHADELREINAAYDAMEKAAQGNADDLIRIATLRNQELDLLNQRLAKSLADLNAEQSAAAFKPLIERLTDGLDEADKATVESVRAQLLAWRAAYGLNSEIVKLIDAALGGVEKRYEDLAKEVTRSVTEAVKASEQLAQAAFGQEAARNLSEVERLLASAADRASKIREQQAANNKLLAAAVGEEREALLAATAELDAALSSVARDTAAEAERITRRAVEAYQKGLEEATREASAVAAQIVERDAQRVIGRISDVQVNALNEARTNLLRALARLTTAGLSDAALEPIRQQLAELDGLLARQARNTADFASSQLRHLAEVASAVLDEAAAHRVNQSVLRETVRLRRAALDEARAQGSTAEELTQLTQSLTAAQLAYADSLSAQINRLRGVRGEYAGVYSAAADLAGLLDRPVPANVIRAQQQLALSALQNVRALQESGAAYSDYNDDLSEAINLWRDFEVASGQSIRASASDFRRLWEGEVERANREFSTFETRNMPAFQELANRLAEAFGLTFNQASARILSFLSGDLSDVLADLQHADPTVLSDIFAAVNDEAVKTPGTIREIDAEIDSLESRLTDLKTEIASAVNFDAAAQQLVSGYQVVLDQVAAVTGETFGDAAQEASWAFTDRLHQERTRLQDELDSVLGPVADAAGALAGEGLMNAFAAGITRNQALVINAVEDVLRRVRELLPSSDAKRGPLSDLTHSGRMFVKTFMSGMLREQTSLVAGVSSLLASIRPPAALTAGGGVVMHNYFEGTPAPVAGTFTAEAKKFARLATREVDAQLRLRGR